MTNPFITIRAIRGAPLTVLVSLLQCSRPSGANELSRLTGFTRKTVANALMVLDDLGLVDKSDNRVRSFTVSSLAMELLFSKLGVISTPNDSTIDDVVINRAYSVDKRVKEHQQQKQGYFLPQFSPEQKTVHDFLIERGIIDPKAREIALSWWCTFDYVAAVYEAGKRKKLSDGLIIYQLLNHVPMPAMSDSFDAFIQR